MTKMISRVGLPTYVCSYFLPGDTSARQVRICAEDYTRAHRQASAFLRDTFHGRATLLTVLRWTSALEEPDVQNVPIPTTGEVKR